MGLNPMIWGSQTWHAIHSVALAYPEDPTPEDKKTAVQFIDAIADSLPCEMCSVNFKKKIATHPPDVTSRTAFFNWTVDVHNMVNVQTGKPELSYSQALKEFRDNTTQIKEKALIQSFSIAVGLCVLVLIISWYYVKVAKKN